MLQERLQQTAASRGLVLTPEQLARFETFYQELVEWNTRFNLTRITDYEAVQVQLFLDSLVVLQAPGQVFTPGAAVIDVGAGAGLPGVALKIARPDLRLTLIDSVGKKVRFLDHLISRLGLTDSRALHSRAEDLGQNRTHRERYDVAVARAVADLAVLVEYLLPLTRVGGAVVAQKGARAEEELARAGRAVATLGGATPTLAPYSLPGLDEPRALVVIPKVKPTPRAYPRKAGAPEREPLGG